ncbi:MAG: hypothetical protein ABRQ32_07805 [Smithellaceae bacterium]|jgi:hypothetical protein
MSSKSKDVRIEQRRMLEEKLDLRLQQLAQKGISKEKAQSNPLVKNLKAKIRETNTRIKAVEKIEKLNEDLAQAKILKLTAPAKKEGEEGKESKSKKKAAAAANESKKKQAGGDASNKAGKKKQASAK